MVKSQYESELKRRIAYIIVQQLSDPRLGWVTVSSVRLSKDWHEAQVYICVLELEKEMETLEVLKRATGFIRTCLSKTLPWKYIPRLEFKIDRQEWISEQNSTF